MGLGSRREEAGELILTSLPRSSLSPSRNPSSLPMTFTAKEEPGLWESGQRPSLRLGRGILGPRQALLWNLRPVARPL